MPLARDSRPEDLPESVHRIPDTAVTEPLDTVLNHDLFTPRLLVLLANAITQRESASLRHAFGLGTVDWRILSALAVRPGMTVTALSTFSATDRATISRSVSTLIERELIVQGDGPRGTRPLWLTVDGQKMHDAMLPISLRGQTLIDAVLSGTEAAQFDAMLTALIVAADDESVWEKITGPGSLENPTP